MKTVAIISEYNPFHNGHDYQIKKVREELGEDTAVIAIMSGNFTQRGELAVADKLIRATVAVECGVNLVLELPFPFSMSSAEFFARSGVHIACQLGIVDYLVFGSECGDVDLLQRVAKNMQTKEFEEAFNEKKQSDIKLGHAAMCELVYSELYGDISHDFFTSNNILALEYIKALNAEKNAPKPYTIKRKGANYLSSYTPSTNYQSATAVRIMMRAEDIPCALLFVPQPAQKIYEPLLRMGDMPISHEKLDLAVISHFRLNPSFGECDIHDAGGGLYNRLCDISMTETTISSLASKAETKKYTTARIRRAIWNSYFGVTSSMVREFPKFTQVLAMDSVGRSMLKRIKKMSDFPVFTKPSSYHKCSEDVVRQKEQSNRADSIFDLCRNKPISGNFSLLYSPYVKE